LHCCQSNHKSWPVFRSFLSICLQGMRRISTFLSEHNRYRDRESMWRPPKYRPCRVWYFRPCRSLISFTKCRLNEQHKTNSFRAVLVLVARECRPPTKCYIHNYIRHCSYLEINISVSRELTKARTPCRSRVSKVTLFVLVFLSMKPALYEGKFSLRVWVCDNTFLSPCSFKLLLADWRLADL
jgi:hypothetical protein